MNAVEVSLHFEVGTQRRDEFLTLHVLDVTEMSIRPVELVISVVNRDPVGPFQLGGDYRYFVCSIHSNTAYEGFVSPVCPVYKSSKRPR